MSNFWEKTFNKDSPEDIKLVGGIAEFMTFCKKDADGHELLLTLKTDNEILYYGFINWENVKKRYNELQEV